MIGPVSQPHADATEMRHRRSRPLRAEAGLRFGPLVAGIAGAVSLVVAELCPLLDIRTESRVVQTVTGGSHHAYALVLVGLLAGGLALAGFLGGSRPAIAALGLLGLAVAAFALLSDGPDVRATGVVRGFVDATASARIGFYLETLGGALLVLGGGIGLLGEPAPGG